MLLSIYQLINEEFKMFKRKSYEEWSLQRKILEPILSAVLPILFVDSLYHFRLSKILASLIFNIPVE